MTRCRRIGLLLGLALPAAACCGEQRQLLWGDTHLHTSYSFDAYVFNNLTAGPETAYRYARGMPVEHPYHRARVQIAAPLDFLVVSDHAEFLGQIRNIHRHGVDTTGLGFLASLRARLVAYFLNRAIDNAQGPSLFIERLPDPDVTPLEAATAATLGDDSVRLLPMPDRVEIDAWRDITEAADVYNEPGVFSALIGWEWSSIPGGANLHRVVITDSDAGTAQRFSPFGFDDSAFPQDLWDWLDTTSAATGAAFTAIPHNSNISKGMMFADTSLRGDKIDAGYIAQRARWERVVEITQIKGDSETHSLFSPQDTFADFENYPFYIQRKWTRYQPRPGDFVRPALRLGLQLGRLQGQNPYQFGVIGSSDSHTGLSSFEENNFHGKMATDSIPANKQSQVISDGPAADGWSMSASGLAAVWAEDNTRGAILAALRRREVYATTGPRIALQFYGASELGEDDLQRPELRDLVERGAVPMGGELGPLDAAPRFIVTASKDPMEANLDRIQMVKGWVDGAGQTWEQVYNIAWSGSRTLAADGSLGPVGDTVDRRTGKVANTIGATQLATVWRDPTFDPNQAAFYYVRVLQIPTARHSLLDAVALGLEAAPGHPDTIQERAYSSPIWYRPGG